MKVFISWSGKMSGELAKLLRDWLPSVIQAAKPYFSTDDIEKGTRGNSMLAKELEEAAIGILCLTRENLEAPWIMFEAGALSKKLDTSRVCPILFGELGTTDLKGPLTQFQGAKFNKNDMRKLISTINNQLGEAALGPKTLDTVFDKWWPDLDEKVKSLLSDAPKSTGEKMRNDRELLEEILTLTRRTPLYLQDLAHNLLIKPSMDQERDTKRIGRFDRKRALSYAIDLFNMGYDKDYIKNELKDQGV